MKNNKLQPQEKKYIKAVVEMYKFKITIWVFI